MITHVYLPAILTYFPVLANLLVLGFSLHVYLEFKKISLLLIAVSAFLGAFVSVLPQITSTKTNNSLVYWYIFHLCNTLSFAGWMVGGYLLVKDYMKRFRADGLPKPLTNKEHE